MGPCLRYSVAALASLLVACSAPVRAEGGAMRAYNQRMEALFNRLDGNRDGKLQSNELRGHPALIRRLQRQSGSQHLLFEDVRGEAGQLRGKRLVRRFRLADLDGDQRLSKQEASAMPWVARHFEALDQNRDRWLTLRELLDLQKALSPAQRRP